MVWQALLFGMIFAPIFNQRTMMPESLPELILLWRLLRVNMLPMIRDQMEQKAIGLLGSSWALS